jgi:hypothetical protein
MINSVSLINNQSNPPINIKQVGFFKSMCIISSKVRNWPRGANAIIQSCALDILRLLTYINKKIKFSESIEFTYKKQEAKFIRLSAEIKNSLVKSLFKDDFLASSCNILETNAFNEKKDLESVNKIMEIFNKNIKFANGSDKDIKDFEKRKFEFISLRNGVCKGASIDFIHRYLYRDSNKTVKEIVNENFKNGAPAEAGGLQAFFQWIIKTSVFTCASEFTDFGPDLVKSRLSEFNENEAFIAWVHKIKPGETTVKLSNTSTIDQLNARCLSKLPIGIYEMRFSTGSVAHVTVFIKEANCSYIFDPNYGLISCNSEPEEHLATLLSLYDPPADTPGNYWLNLQQYVKL